ncbi:hypothetical protein B0I35DRAFT_439164 [Stachybotrys elegans]|uniref:Fucose-specific lectin n=1 Tax=Stachybotrys elegans TaxID=80388 RepID=A0A8K0SPE6_9HYPO|nr:hypothetical protein B0I35DRAFT_439164 [Stachybotrys elegans]
MEHRIQSPHDYGEWSGLEAVRDNEAPQAVGHGYDETPQVLSHGSNEHQHQHSSLEQSTSSPDSHEPHPEKTTAAGPWWRRRRYIAIIVVTVALVIGGILGGVLGARAAEGSDSTPPPTSVARGSPLAVTSYSTRSWDEIILAFKDNEGNPKYSIRRNRNRNRNSPWPPPQTIRGVAPLEQSRLALSTQAYGANTSYTLFYVNETSFINSVNISTFDSNPKWRDGAVGAEGYQASETGSLSAYGPWIVYRNGLSSLRIRHAGGARGHRNDSSTAHAAYNSVVPSAASKWVMVPLLTNSTSLKQRFDWAVICQQEDGTLGAYVWTQIGWYGSIAESEEDELLEEPIRSWPQSFPDNITIPMGGAFSAFVTARSNGSELVNTYILYQDEDRHIKQAWMDDSEEWQFSSPEALRYADEDTDIACLTMSMSPTHLDADDWRFPVFLSADINLQRCFFQRGGYIIEVSRVDNEWRETARIPDEES